MPFFQFYLNINGARALYRNRKIKVHIRRGQHGVAREVHVGHALPAYFSPLIATTIIMKAKNSRQIHNYCCCIALGLIEILATSASSLIPAPPPVSVVAPPSPPGI